MDHHRSYRSDLEIIIIITFEPNAKEISSDLTAVVKNLFVFSLLITAIIFRAERMPQSQSVVCEVRPPSDSVSA